MASARRIATILTVHALLSCKGPTEVSVRDTEGRVFSARCPGAPETCTLKQQAGPRAANATPALRASGRFVGVCDSSHDADCRALTCASDDDCPPPGKAQGGSCLAGFCVDPTHDIASSDAVMACLAGSGLGHADARQVERYALGLNCGTPCTIPKPCERR
ncbi:MAG: hypothetical protein ACOY0T_11520 [Myxococcota bacterium]